MVFQALEQFKHRKNMLKENFVTETGLRNFLSNQLIMAPIAHILFEDKPLDYPPDRLSYTVDDDQGSNQ